MTATLNPAQMNASRAMSALEESILDIEMFAQVGIGEADQGTPAWAHLLHKMSDRLREQFNAMADAIPLRNLQAPTYTTDPQRVEALSAAMDAYATQGDQG